MVFNGEEATLILTGIKSGITGSSFLSVDPKEINISTVLLVEFLQSHALLNKRSSGMSPEDKSKRFVSIVERDLFLDRMRLPLEQALRFSELEDFFVGCLDL